MQMAEARVRRAQHLAEGAESQLWPAINFSGYLQRQKFSEFGIIPPPFNGKTFTIGELGFNFNYEFDFWGKNRQLLAAKLNETCAAWADLAEARLILSSAVATTYFQLLGNIEAFKLAKANLDQATAISNIVLDRAKNGIESDIPVKTAISNTDTAALAVQQYRQQEKLFRHQLAVLLGKNAFAVDIETRKFAFHPYDIKLPALLPANLLARRPDIFAARSRVCAAANQINVAKARFFPNINLTALFSYQSVGLGHLFDVASQNNALTGAVDLPIFDAGARRANLGIQYAEYDVAVNEYNQTILIALREVADQVSNLHSLQAQLKTQRRVLDAIERNYKLFRFRYRHGIIDYVPVLELKESLLEQQAKQVTLQVNHLQAVVAMLTALGGDCYG